MRKSAFRLVMLTAIATIVIATGARAALVGGLASPLNESEASLSLILAYQERDVGDGSNDEASSRRFLFKGGYGFGRGASIYAMAGLSDIGIDSINGKDFSGSLGESYGIGFKYSPIEFADGTKFVLDGQAEFTSSTYGTKRVESTVYRTTAYIVGKFGSSGKFGFFYPYSGLAYSSASYDMHTLGGKHDDGFRLGVVSGSDFYINPNVYLTVEFHIFDESAAYVSAGYRF